jgi:predicted nuclease of predicted toxin-antitoxin system
MNVLDENIPETQRGLLLRRRIRVRKIGVDVGRKGMDDEEIIPLLRRLNRPTFFTQDRDFYKRTLCHRAYCLVQLNLEDVSIADYVRRLLRHGEFNTKAKRMGCVIRIGPTTLAVWRLGEPEETFFEWD